MTKKKVEEKGKVDFILNRDCVKCGYEYVHITKAEFYEG